MIVPVDDSLIFGPSSGLEDVVAKIDKILEDPPDALLAFPGVFVRRPFIHTCTAGILNVTASTARSTHTRKVKVGDVHQAAQLALDAVAVHVNVTSKYESEMLATFGTIARECESYGMPLVGIMYPRTETATGDDNHEQLRDTDRKRYTDLVAHSARVGVDLGADLIKTYYTGDPESFTRVVESCQPVPIVVAGGPLRHPESVLQTTSDVMRAGGAGISFGRNIFGHDSPRALIAALKAVVHHGVEPTEALAIFKAKSASTRAEEVT